MPFIFVKRNALYVSFNDDYYNTGATCSFLRWITYLAIIQTVICYTPDCSSLNVWSGLFGILLSRNKISPDLQIGLVLYKDEGNKDNSDKNDSGLNSSGGDEYNELLDLFLYNY